MKAIEASTSRVEAAFKGLLRGFAAIAALTIVMAVGSCSGREDNGVIGIEEMASLMADMHMAEAVIDLNRNDFQTDSSRLLLKQSVYAAHGVTEAEVDSSFVWYGHHVEDYMKVYDRALEILDAREQDLLAASNERIIVEGDSVNVWPLAPSMEISRRSPTRLLTFSVPVDSNWRNGDVFALRYKMVSARRPVVGRIVVEYADGTTAFNLAAGKNKGNAEAMVRVDSTLNPLRVAGYLLAAPEKEETVLLDSISLVRMRGPLVRRHIPQRSFNYGIRRAPQPAPADTASAADSAPLPGATPSTPVTSPKERLQGSGQPHPGHGSQAPSQAVDNSRRGESTAQEALRKQREALNARRRK